MAIKKSILYKSLWDSRDALRGSMDASQYKDYLLVLLFMKYVSDKGGELVERELQIVLKNTTVKIVDMEKGFVQALKTFNPDLVIADYMLLTFDGLSALKIRQDKCLFTPFIILTGSMNEDTAVECMKAGADDYVIKEHIKRLGPAAINALENKKIELKRKQAEGKLISRNKELELYNEVTVDRELIIIELKKEINELLEKSGEKPKYKIGV